MSKLRKPISTFAFIFAATLQFFTQTTAQTLEARLKIEPDAPAALVIEGSFANKTNRSLSFALASAGIDNLGARISDVKLKDKNGRAVSYKKLIDGEFLAENDFADFEYKVNLDAPKRISAHVSWVSSERGILMLNDLLPLAGEKAAAKIAFDLPKDWKISSAEKRLNGDVFEISDIEKAVFFVGTNFRERELSVGSAKLNFTISGEFLFSDEQAVQAAREIFAEYEKLFGATADLQTQISLVRFPPDVKFGRWEAETRGANVSIISADMPFITQSVQRLHEQLRHEIFHLWMPNALNLSGSYDWFYEGFALYESLRLGIRLNRLRFEDYLDTLARAHSADSLQTPKVSLLEASENRWNGANTQVYARGMLVAFLIDVALLKRSKGKKSFTMLLREIYRKHNYANPRTDANAAILRILEADDMVRPILEKYVKGAEKIVWQTDLAAVGIESAEENFTTRLRVTPKPNGRQKDLLDKLGYNNWRKLSQD